MHKTGWSRVKQSTLAIFLAQMQNEKDQQKRPFTKKDEFRYDSNPIGSMGRFVYLPTNLP